MSLQSVPFDYSTLSPEQTLLLFSLIEVNHYYQDAIKKGPTQLPDALSQNELNEISNEWGFNVSPTRPITRILGDLVKAGLIQHINKKYKTSLYDLKPIGLGLIPDHIRKHANLIDHDIIVKVPCYFPPSIWEFYHFQLGYPITTGASNGITIPVPSLSICDHSYIYLYHDGTLQFSFGDQRTHATKNESDVEAWILAMCNFVKSNIKTEMRGHLTPENLTLIDVLTPHDFRLRKISRGWDFNLNLTPPSSSPFREIGVHPLNSTEIVEIYLYVKNGRLILRYAEQLSSDAIKLSSTTGIIPEFLKWETYAESTDGITPGKPTGASANLLFKIHSTIANVQTQIADFRNTTPSKADLSLLRTEVVNARSELNSLKTNHASQLKRIDQINTNQLDFQKDIKDVNSELGLIDFEISTLEETIEKQKLSFDIGHSILSASQTHNQNTTNQKLKSIEQNLKNTENTIQNVKGFVANEISDVRNSVGTIKQSVKGTIANLTKEIKTFPDEFTKINQSTSQITQSIQTIENEITTLKTELNQKHQIDVAKFTAIQSVIVENQSKSDEKFQTLIQKSDAIQENQNRDRETNEIKFHTMQTDNEMKFKAMQTDSDMKFKDVIQVFGTQFQAVLQEVKNLKEENLEMKKQITELKQPFWKRIRH